MRPRVRAGLWLGALGLAIGLASIPALYEYRADAQDCRPVARRVMPTEPLRAAKLADAIADDPTLADCELSRRGMNRSDYVLLMDRIAADDRLAAAYAGARKR